MPDPDETTDVDSQDPDSALADDSATAELEAAKAAEADAAAAAAAADRQRIFEEVHNERYGTSPETVETHLVEARQIKDQAAQPAAQAQQATQQEAEDLDEPVTKRDLAAFREEVAAGRAQTTAEIEARQINQQLVAAITEYDVKAQDDQADIYHAAVGRMRRSRGAMTPSDAVERVMAARGKHKAQVDRAAQNKRAAAKIADSQARGEAAGSGSAASPGKATFDIRDDEARLKEVRRVLQGG